MRIAFRIQKSFLAVCNKLRIATDRCSDNRQTACHGLKDGVAHPFGFGIQYENIKSS